MKHSYCFCPSRDQTARAVLSAGVALLLAATFAISLARADSLTLQFADEKGTPLRNVQVQITNLETKSTKQKKTNKEGRIQFGDLTPGTYELRAQLKGFAPIRESLQVADSVQIRKVLADKKWLDSSEAAAVQAINTKEFSKAAATLEEVLQYLPQDAKIHELLARAYAGLLEEDKALKHAELAAKLDPDSRGTPQEVQTYILRELGQKALLGKDFPEATRYFKRLVAIDPQSAEAFYGLALAYGHQQNHEEALAAIDQALRLAPQNEMYQKVKEMLLINAGVK